MVSHSRHLDVDEDGDNGFIVLSCLCRKRWKGVFFVYLYCFVMKDHLTLQSWKKKSIIITAIIIVINIMIVIVLCDEEGQDKKDKKERFCLSFFLYDEVK